MEAWLKGLPGVEIIARDRAGTFADGARRGAPSAVQVADRCHLLCNLGEAVHHVLEQERSALLETVQQIYQQQLQAAGNPTPEPLHLDANRSVPKAGPTQQARFEAITTLAAQGYGQRTIARQLGIHRKTVSKYLHSKEVPVRQLNFQSMSKVTPYLAFVRQRLAEGCPSAQQLWRYLQIQGYTGSYSSVARAMKHFRPGDARRVRQAICPIPMPRLSPRQAMWLLVRPDDALDADQKLQRETLRRCCPSAEQAYHLAQRFVSLINQRRVDLLDAWLMDAEHSPLAPFRHFARSLRRDEAALRAAVTSNWSNGQTEGQVNRLKFLKRQMFGRASFELLRSRILQPR